MGKLPLCGVKLTRTMTIHELWEKMQKEDWIILDVRSKSEWDAGHIEGSININVNSLKNYLSRIPGNKLIAVICQSGARSNLAAMILERSGKHNVFNVPAGMSGWKRANYPTITI